MKFLAALCEKGYYCNTSTKVKPSQSLSVAGINDNDLSSDCDFDVTQKITRKRKKRSVISTIAKHNINSKGTSNNYETHPITWGQLPPDIQSVLPHDEEYTYVVQSHQTCTTKSFEGAPEFAFEALVRINLDDSEAVDKWLKKMMDASTE